MYAAKHVTMQRTAPTTKNYTVQNVNNANVNFNYQFVGFVYFVKNIWLKEQYA